MEVTELQNEEKKKFEEAIAVDIQSQEIRTALEQGNKEMKRVALELCQWKHNML